MKRFYKSVSLSEGTTEGYGLLLDHKPVQTPARKPFFIQSKKIASLVVKEWEDQGETVQPLKMPVSQMAMTLIDRVIPFRDKLESEILGYINTDLVSYRTSEPEQYKRIQEEKWDPFIIWFKNIFGLHFEVTYGLSPLTQSPDIHHAIHHHINRLSDEKMMALYLGTLGTGSIVLGLAFISLDFTVDDILAAAFAEEKLKDTIYLGEIYGSAPDQEKKYKTLKTELETLLHFIT
jgi:chaperone required for assembly of F1-ATPase